jgi:hypothetical protein
MDHAEPGELYITITTQALATENPATITVGTDAEYDPDHIYFQLQVDGGSGVGPEAGLTREAATALITALQAAVRDIDNTAATRALAAAASVRELDAAEHQPDAPAASVPPSRVDDALAAAEVACDRMDNALANDHTDRGRPVRPHETAHTAEADTALDRDIS